MTIFDIGVATIFAREFLEGSIIISQYRTVLQRSEEWQDPDRQKEGLRAITVSATIAGLVALVLCVSIGVSLYFVGKEMDDKTAEIVEGLSKVVASVCLLQLSLKLPKWLQVYPSTSKNGDKSIGVTLKEIRFNVSWNIWREVAECGVFLFPYFLDSDSSVEVIPVSALIGVAISLLLSLLMAYAARTGTQVKVCIFMTTLCSMLAIGLFVGGVHEFEEVGGETPELWCIKGDFWDQNHFPMTIFYPFGYTSCPTILHISTLVVTMCLVGALHYRKYRMAMKIKGEKMEQEVLTNTNSDHEKDEESSPGVNDEIDGNE